MSTTIEIDPDDWREFFDSFSRRHDGWLVTVRHDEVLEIESDGAQTLIHFRSAMPTEAVDGVAP